MVNLSDHIEVRGEWRVVRANAVTVPFSSTGRFAAAISQAREDIFLFLVKMLFDFPLGQGSGMLDGSSWIEGDHRYYHSHSSNFTEPASFIASTGAVERVGNKFRIALPLDDIESHAKAAFHNLEDYDTMIAHALCDSLLFWDEDGIWKGLQYGAYGWVSDTPESRDARLERAREVLDLIPSLYVLGLVDFDFTNGRYLPTAELNRVSDLVV